jgi:hypothetical protein
VAFEEFGGSTYLLSDARRDGVLAVRARRARDPLFGYSRTAGTPSLLCRDSNHDEEMLAGNREVRRLNVLVI